MEARLPSAYRRDRRFAEISNEHTGRFQQVAVLRVVDDTCVSPSWRLP